MKTKHDERAIPLTLKVATRLYEEGHFDAGNYIIRNLNRYIEQDYEDAFFMPSNELAGMFIWSNSHQGGKFWEEVNIWNEND